MLKSYSVASTLVGFAPFVPTAATGLVACGRPYHHQLRNIHLRSSSIGVSSQSNGQKATHTKPTPTLWRSAARYMSSGNRDPYTVLGVSRSASQDEIKAAYKKLVLQYHPDQNKSPGAEDKFKDISAAYNTLRDQGKRREYDAGSPWGSSSGGGGSSAGASGGYGPAGGSASSGYSSTGTTGSSRGPDKFGNYQHHTVNREEADRIFKEMFGSRDFDSIFKDFYQQQQGGQRTGGAASSTQGGAKVTRDEFIRDAQGNTYRVTTWETGGSQQQERDRGRRRKEPANMHTGYPGDDFFTKDTPHHGLSGRGRNPVNPFFSGPSTGSPFSSFFSQAGNPFGQRTGNPFTSNQQQSSTAQGFSGAGSAAGTGGGETGTNSGPFGQDGSHQGGAEGYRTGNIGQHPFYWDQPPPAFSFNPWRIFMWVFLLGAFSSLIMGFFFSHPGLILLMAFFWIIFRRPRI